MRLRTMNAARPTPVDARKLERGLEPTGLTRQIDAFVAAPMSAYSADERAYAENRERLLRLFAGLKAATRLQQFFCPAVIVEKLSDFDDNEHALVQDVLALEQSEFFILYYMPPLPVKPSSVFVEAGMALFARKPSVFIVRSKNDLPYMLRSADQITLERLKATWRGKEIPTSVPSLPFVKIIEVHEHEDVNLGELAAWVNEAHKNLIIPARGSPRT